MSITQFRIKTNFLTLLRIINRKVKESVEGMPINVWQGRVQPKILLSSKYSQTRISRSRISRIFYKLDKFTRSRSASYKSYTFSMRKSDFISRIFA